MQREFSSSSQSPPRPEDHDLLDEAGGIDGAHAVVIGAGALPIMCALIRRGAASAAELQLDDRCATGPAEIALVPHVASLETAGRAISVARRVVPPCGRIVLRVVAPRLATEIAALLRNAGFASVRIAQRDEDAVVSADRPMFGHLLSFGGRA